MENIQHYVNNLNANQDGNYEIELAALKQKLLVLAEKNETLLKENKQLLEKIDEQKNVEKKTETMLLHASKLALLGEMATGVAHELKQPLSIIRTNMQSLEFIVKDKLVLEDIGDIIGSCIRQTDRAANIIDHMRSFARVDQTHNSPIELSKPVDSALELFNEQFRQHEINLVREYDVNIPPLCCSAQEIEQLFVNLLSNARHAVELMNEIADDHYKMQIIIRLKYIENEKKILVEVSDNGIGMSDEVLKRCLDPFFTTKPIGEGTGLGLTIILGIIKGVNGTLDIKSSVNQGATVQISFPA